MVRGCCPVADRFAVGDAIVGDEERDGFFACLSLLKAVEEAVIDLIALHEGAWDEEFANADALVATAGEVSASSFEAMGWLNEDAGAVVGNDDDDPTTGVALVQTDLIGSWFEHRYGVLDGVSGLHVVDDEGAHGVEASGVGSANFYFHTFCKGLRV